MFGREIFTKNQGAASGGCNIPGSCPSPTTILTQAFDSTGTGYISQFDPDVLGDFSKAYDSFSFLHGALLTDVHWTGGYVLPRGEFTSTAFSVQFWADNAGQPAAVALQTESFTPLQANETLVGSFGGLSIYTYSVTLATPFPSDCATTYWLSVQSTLRLPDEWGWASAGAGTAWQVQFGVGASIPNNLAFDLTGCLGT